MLAVRNNPNIFLEIPNNIKIYMFGSSVHAETFNDVDLLFVSPDNVVDKANLYQLIQTTCKKIEEQIGCIIDFTILTEQEENELKFIENSRAILVANI